MNQDNFYELSGKFVNIIKNKETGAWAVVQYPETEKFFVSKDHVVTVGINAAFIIFELVGREKPFNLITAYNLDFFRQAHTKRLLSEEFLALVEEHRKLFEGDETSNLTFADNERFVNSKPFGVANKHFKIIWKARPAITQLPG